MAPHGMRGNARGSCFVCVGGSVGGGVRSIGPGTNPPDPHPNETPITRCSSCTRSRCTTRRSPGTCPPWPATSPGPATSTRHVRALWCCGVVLFCMHVSYMCGLHACVQCSTYAPTPPSKKLPTPADRGAHAAVRAEPERAGGQGGAAHHPALQQDRADARDLRAPLARGLGRQRGAGQERCVGVCLCVGGCWCWRASCHKHNTIHQPPKNTDQGCTPPSSCGTPTTAGCT